MKREEYSADGKRNSSIKMDRQCFQFQTADKKYTCSSPPVRAPKSQLVVGQPSKGGCWNLPKKDSPHPKMKKKPKWDGRRGTIMIKSNPIPAECMTHKLENNNTREVLWLLWRFGTPCQISQPGAPTKGLGILRESDLEGQWDLTIRLPQD